MTESEREKVIREICEYAEEKISGVGCSKVDAIVFRMVDLLASLGEEAAAERVSAYYRAHWGPE